MYKYNDSTMKCTAPTTVEFNGFQRAFKDLTREEQDEIGFNEAVPLKREPFTIYETKWVKGADLIIREEIISAVVDEDAKNESKAAEVRLKRDRLLAESDWTQLADSPLDETGGLAWKEYRTELRNLPQQSGFPSTIQWPGEPAK